MSTHQVRMGLPLARRCLGRRARRSIPGDETAHASSFRWRGSVPGRPRCRRLFGRRSTRWSQSCPDALRYRTRNVRPVYDSAPTRLSVCTCRGTRGQLSTDATRSSPPTAVDHDVHAFDGRSGRAVTLALVWPYPNHRQANIRRPLGGVTNSVPSPGTRGAQRRRFVEGLRTTPAEFAFKSPALQ